MSNSIFQSIKEKSDEKMQINKIYALSCYADYGVMWSPFFGTKEEAIDYLDNFQEEILKENDNTLMINTQIELLEIDLDQVAHLDIISTWKECQEEDFYCWHDTNEKL